MNNEIISVFEYFEKEKNVPRNLLIPVISDAIKNAAEKGANAGQDLKIEIDPKTGDITSFVQMTVVDSVADPLTEIHIVDAKEYAPNPQLGDIVEKTKPIGSLGRITAQKVQQAIGQWLRQYERESTYEKYKNQIGEIVTGTVQRRDRGDLFIELEKEKVEAILPWKEGVPGEDFKTGNFISALLLKMDSTPRGPEIILSRTDKNFVRRMLEKEVNELKDGTIKIVRIERDPGNRTKIAVASEDPNIDPVGACVGQRGIRIRTLVKELNGEKIDIIRYSADPRIMLAEAIKPAIPRNVQIDEAKHCIYFEVSPDDMSIALGKKGQNARLTSRLMGWRLDIDRERSKAESQIGDKIGQIISVFVQQYGLTEDLATRLVNAGFTDLQIFDDEEIGENLNEAGFSGEEVETILSAIQKK